MKIFQKIFSGIFVTLFAFNFSEFKNVKAVKIYEKADSIFKNSKDQLEMKSSIFDFLIECLEKNKNDPKLGKMLQLFNQFKSLDDNKASEGIQKRIDFYFKKISKLNEGNIKDVLDIISDVFIETNVYNGENDSIILYQKFDENLMRGFEEIESDCENDKTLAENFVEEIEKNEDFVENRVKGDLFFKKVLVLIYNIKNNLNIVKNNLIKTVEVVLKDYKRATLGKDDSNKMVNICSTLRIFLPTLCKKISVEDSYDFQTLTETFNKMLDAFKRLIADSKFSDETKNALYSSLDKIILNGVYRNKRMIEFLEEIASWDHTILIGDDFFENNYLLQKSKQKKLLSLNNNHRIFLKGIFSNIYHYLTFLGISSADTLDEDGNRCQVIEFNLAHSLALKKLVEKIKSDLKLDKKTIYECFMRFLIGHELGHAIDKILGTFDENSGKTESKSINKKDQMEITKQKDELFTIMSTMNKDFSSSEWIKNISTNFVELLSGVKAEIFADYSSLAANAILFKDEGKNIDYIRDKVLPLFLISLCCYNSFEEHGVVMRDEHPPYIIRFDSIIYQISYFNELFKNEVESEKEFNNRITDKKISNFWG